MKESNEEFWEKVKEALNSSPYYKHIKMSVVNFSDNSAELQINIEEFHNNLYGVAHGGAIASIIDSACGVSLLTHLQPGDMPVTVDLKISFFLPVKKGKLKALGKVIFKGNTISVEEAEIFDEEGKLLAKGTATHFIKKDV